MSTIRYAGRGDADAEGRASAVLAVINAGDVRDTPLLNGGRPQRVQQQLGHASIKVTIDKCGSWIRARAPDAADQLEALVANEAANSGAWAKLIGRNARRNRRGTLMLRI